jgi:hypothetical protein
VSRDEASVQLQLPIAEILAGVNDTVEALAAEAGLLVMKALIEEEVERRLGPRYAHAAGRTAVRPGGCGRVCDATAGASSTQPQPTRPPAHTGWME